MTFYNIKLFLPTYYVRTSGPPCFLVFTDSTKTEKRKIVPAYSVYITFSMNNEFIQILNIGIFKYTRS